MNNINGCYAISVFGKKNCVNTPFMFCVFIKQYPFFLEWTSYLCNIKLCNNEGHK